MQAPTLDERRRQDQQYIRLERLGEGGMADAFLGVRREGSIEQRVCLKEIKSDIWGESEFRKAFFKEAEIAASLRHSNIVGVIEVDADLGRLVLELVEGVNLRELIKSAPNHRLPADFVLYIASELCHALAYAHDRTVQGKHAGVVHRDLSPKNVLISYDGGVKLTDFGLAAIINTSGEPYSRTIRGKIQYLSPEQCNQECLDGRSDLFALGVLCHELLTGKRPFDAESDVGTMRAIRRGKRVPLAELVEDAPSALVDFIERLLQPKREDRYADANACLDVLEQMSVSRPRRALGRLAREARPRKTLDYDLLSERAARARLEAQLGQNTVVIRKPSTTWRRTAGAIAALTAAAGIAGMGWLLNSPDDHVVQRGTPSSPEPLNLEPPGVKPTMLTAQAVPASDLGAPKKGSLAPTASSPSPVAVPPPLPATPPAMEAAPVRPASLTLGTIPLARVWIDGQPRGWSPVTVTLPSGLHTVSVGMERPELKRTLRLRPGESKDLLLELARQP